MNVFRLSHCKRALKVHENGHGLSLPKISDLDNKSMRSSWNHGFVQSGKDSRTNYRSPPSAVPGK